MHSASSVNDTSNIDDDGSTHNGEDANATMQARGRGGGGRRRGQNQNQYRNRNRIAQPQTEQTPFSEMGMAMAMPPDFREANVHLSDQPPPPPLPHHHRHHPNHPPPVPIPPQVQAQRHDASVNDSAFYYNGNNDVASGSYQTAPPPPTPTLYFPSHYVPPHGHPSSYHPHHNLNQPPPMPYNYPNQTAYVHQLHHHHHQQQRPTEHQTGYAGNPAQLHPYVHHIQNHPYFRYQQQQQMQQQMHIQAHNTDQMAKTAEGVTKSIDGNASPKFGKDNGSSATFSEKYAGTKRSDHSGRFHDVDSGTNLSQGGIEEQQDNGYSKLKRREVNGPRSFPHYGDPQPQPPHHPPFPPPPGVNPSLYHQTYFTDVDRERASFEEYWRAKAGAGAGAEAGAKSNAIGGTHGQHSTTVSAPYTYMPHPYLNPTHDPNLSGPHYPPSSQPAYNPRTSSLGSSSYSYSSSYSTATKPLGSPSSLSSQLWPMPPGSAEHSKYGGVEYDGATPTLDMMTMSLTPTTRNGIASHLMAPSSPLQRVEYEHTNIDSPVPILSPDRDSEGSGNDHEESKDQRQGKGQGRDQTNENGTGSGNGNGNEMHDSEVHAWLEHGQAQSQHAPSQTNSSREEEEEEGKQETTGSQRETQKQTRSYDDSDIRMKDPDNQNKTSTPTGQNGIHPKHNSTSSLYVNSTMRMPNHDEILQSVGTVLQCIVEQTVNENGGEVPIKEEFKLFDERYWAKKHPADTSAVGAALFGSGQRKQHLQSKSRAGHGETSNSSSNAALQALNEEDSQSRVADVTEFVIPSVQDIYQFLKRIFDLAQFSAECSTISLVLINRLLNFTDMPMHQSTWRPLLLCSLLISQKIWDDRCLANVDFPVIWREACPNAAQELSVKAVNAMEAKYLELVHFNVFVSSSLYAKYFFELRTLHDSSVAERAKHAQIPPLSKDGANQLEANSSMVSQEFESAQKRKIKSHLDNQQGARPRAVLS